MCETATTCLEVLNYVILSHPLQHICIKVADYFCSIPPPPQKKPAQYEMECVPPQKGLRPEKELEMLHLSRK